MTGVGIPGPAGPPAENEKGKDVNQELVLTLIYRDDVTYLKSIITDRFTGEYASLLNPLHSPRSNAYRMQYTLQKASLEWESRPFYLDHLQIKE